MTSRLFHTVVGVGLALGAMSMGCAAEPETASTDTAAATTYGEPPKVETDRFCEVPWPTTKGSKPATSADAQACIDPQNECGAYPRVAEGWGEETCVHAADVTSCDFMQGELWMFCKDNGTSHAWTCPAGTILATQCVWPDNEAPQKEARR